MDLHSIAMLAAESLEHQGFLGTTNNPYMTISQDVKKRDVVYISFLSNRGKKTNLSLGQDRTDESYGRMYIHDADTGDTVVTSRDPLAALIDLVSELKQRIGK